MERFKAIGRLANSALVILEIMMGMVMVYLMCSRFIFEAMSETYHPEGPLMGSYLLEILIRGESALVLSALLAGIIVKEFSMESVKTRLIINLSFLCVLASAEAYAVYALCFPIR